MEFSISHDPKASEKKKSLSIQELVESLKSTADDIGQISELSSEERILVSQFFISFLKLMQPLTPSIAVSQLSLPTQLSDAVQAHIDPTGHLALLFTDGHLELEDLSEDHAEAVTQVEIIGNQITTSLNRPYQLDAYEYYSTPSIGIAMFGDHGKSHEELLKHADIAMYQAKKAGRNRLHYFDAEMQKNC